MPYFLTQTFLKFDQKWEMRDKMAAYFFALKEIVVNLSLVFCSLWYIISV